jgi:zinc transport system permease protein
LAIYLGLPILFGATIFSVIVAILIAILTLNYNKRLDAIIGIMWSFGMAIGIVFVDLTPGYNVDLMSYLFGSIISVTSLDIYYIFILDIVVIFSIILFYRQFLAISYDIQFAKLKGVNIKFFYILLLVLVSLTIVATIKVVGLILVIALLTIPTYIAELFSNSLYKMMIISCILSILFGISGIFISYFYDISSGASIILISILCLIILSLYKRLFYIK